MLTFIARGSQREILNMNKVILKVQPCIVNLKIGGL